jgi:hypothetical protein
VVEQEKNSGIRTISVMAKAFGRRKSIWVNIPDKRDKGNVLSLKKG